MSVNPYQSPLVDARVDTFDPTTNDQLAGRFTRFAAVLVDGIFLMLILVPIQYASGSIQRAMNQEIGLIEQLLLLLLGIAVMLALNGYPLATRGQTIGKILTGIQIVDVENGKLLPFLKVYVFRYLWTLPLVLVVAMIPGTTDDLSINGLVLIDALLIFGATRRCLHDLIAGSRVVLYRAGRSMSN